MRLNFKIDRYISNIFDQIHQSIKQTTRGRSETTIKEGIQNDWSQRQATEIKMMTMKSKVYMMILGFTAVCAMPYNKTASRGKKLFYKVFVRYVRKKLYDIAKKKSVSDNLHSFLNV